jgi:glycine/D-amino acid oxidase-like deaminating enzyme
MMTRTLGRAVPDAATRQYPVDWDREADVVVIGAGATGLPAAIAACEAGCSVILVEAEKDIGNVKGLSIELGRSARALASARRSAGTSSPSSTAARSKSTAWPARAPAILGDGRSGGRRVFVDRLSFFECVAGECARCRRGYEFTVRMPSSQQL